MSSDVKLTQNQSREMDTSILSYIDDLVSIVDKNYRYRAVSKGYESFFGCDHSQIIGKHVSEVHGEAVFETHIKAELDRTLAGEEHTFRFWRPDSRGDLRFLDVKHTCYRGPLTEGPGVAVVVRDVTEIVRANEATEQKQELLNTIINAIPDLIFAKDSNGVYQVCNKSFEEFLGFTAEHIIGKTDYELMSEESATYINRRDKEVRASHEAQRYDEWVRYQDGRRRLLDMYKLPLLEKGRSEAGVLGIGRNVTYERKAEQNLLMASLVFDTTPDPCIIFDNKGGIISCNEAAIKRFDQLKSDYQKQDINDLFHCPSLANLDLNTLLGDTCSWYGEICSCSENNSLLATINLVQGQFEQLNKYVLIIRDEKTHQEIAENLLHIAYQDSLTSLPNRRLFYSRLESAIIRAERQLSQLAVMYIDLNDFKPVNDQYGHAVGDQVLIEIAGRLQSCFRSTDTLARIGGDEFVALVDIEHPEQAKAVAEKVLKSLDPPLVLDDSDQTIISASIGISLFPSDAGSAEELLLKADEAMYRAKREAGRYCEFSGK
ncbi:diguanylate cyclase domain-containing protein [Aliamphritea hakodatensis]|uniref:diguanylate cyclase domain-containing protein n=1 Tax=Aliamphritea hakodatensis TaxID=2895352 RepID=UPI0022FD47BE|nr:diguanylate cyclase [Aliamphritea hakodatensis]